MDREDKGTSSGRSEELSGDRQEVPPEYVKCPAKTITDSSSMFTLIRARHETVNGRFKKYNCLKVPWRHDILQHSMCFCAAAVLTQIAIKNEDVLFDVDYIDPSF